MHWILYSTQVYKDLDWADFLDLMHTDITRQALKHFINTV